MDKKRVFQASNLLQLDMYLTIGKHFNVERQDMVDFGIDMSFVDSMYEFKDPAIINNESLPSNFSLELTKLFLSKGVFQPKNIGNILELSARTYKSFEEKGVFNLNDKEKKYVIEDAASHVRGFCTMVEISAYRMNPQNSDWEVAKFWAA